MRFALLLALAALFACHHVAAPPRVVMPLPVFREVGPVPGWPVSRGSLTNAQLVGAFKRQGSALALCYTHQPSGLTRVVKVWLLIGPTGAVLDDRIEESSLTDEQSQCVLAAVKQWMFPAPEGGGHFIVRCNLRFRHDDAPDRGAPAQLVP
jgi:hypothetical protein